MRNNMSKNVLGLIRDLPYFTVDDLKDVIGDKNYLRILLFRFLKGGKIIRLKKGMYVSKEFVEKIKNTNAYSDYLEFLASAIYEPAYLSLDYILYENNLLTEIPANFTLVSKNKTKFFGNNFGNFIYHSIKDELFCGFSVIRKDNFVIYKATKAKALFDFLYFRKNLIVNEEYFDELRLNLENFSAADKKEFLKYVNLEGSKKLKEASKYV